MTMNTKHLDKTIHNQCGKAIDMVIKSSLVRKSLDNVTAVMVSFKNFENCYNLLSSDKSKNYDKIPIQIPPQTAKNTKTKVLSLQEINNKENTYNYEKSQIKEYYENKHGMEKHPNSSSGIPLYARSEDFKTNSERNGGGYIQNQLKTPSPNLSKSVSLEASNTTANKKVDYQKKSNGINNNNGGYTATYNTNTVRNSLNTPQLQYTQENSKDEEKYETKLKDRTNIPKNFNNTVGNPAYSTKNYGNNLVLNTESNLNYNSNSYTSYNNNISNTNKQNNQYQSFSTKK